MARPWVFSILLLLDCLASAAHAAAIEGVWEGTLGDQGIVACFNGADRAGSYYYKRFLTPIPLARTVQDAAWHEEGDTGLWVLDAPGDATLGGTWRNPKGGDPLPIALRLIDGGGDPRACVRDSYNAPLETAPRLAVGKKTSFAPHRSYRTLRFAGQETIELFGPEPATDIVNRQLRADLNQSQEAIQAYFKRRREIGELYGVRAEDDTGAEPIYWTSRWVTVRNDIWYAGTGRVGIDWGLRTWDLTSGKQVDLWSWFGQDSRSEDRLYGNGRGTPSPKLERFLFRYAGIDPKAEAYSGPCSERYDLTLEPTGMRFYRWQDYGGGCEADILVPYHRLSPVLSPAGKAAVRSIIGAKRRQ